MSAPQLTRKLVLEEPQRSVDGAGGYDVLWVEMGTLWGAVEARSGRESGVLGGAVSRVSYRITIRAAQYGAPSRPVAKQRLRDGSRLFQIDAVAESKFGPGYLTCYATEEVAQ